MSEITNRSFAAKDVQFNLACAFVKIPATKRQAGKWKRRVGLAFRVKGHQRFQDFANAERHDMALKLGRG